MADVLTKGSDVSCGSSIPPPDFAALSTLVTESLSPDEIDAIEGLQDFLDQVANGSFSLPSGGLHGGQINLGDTRGKLNVEGHAVLLKSDIENHVISSCSTPGPPPPTTVTKPCQTVRKVLSGEATKLKVNGQGVMLEGIQGITDGIPPGTLAAHADQDKLKAI